MEVWSLLKVEDRGELKSNILKSINGLEELILVI
jgi:hypothetical protein